MIERELIAILRAGLLACKLAEHPTGNPGGALIRLYYDDLPRAAKVYVALLEVLELPARKARK